MIGSGRGAGGGFGRGQGRGRGGGRFGGDRSGLGPNGNCVCPSCGYKMPKQPGVPCNQVKCPKCGTVMIREM
jgi:hypothetical protein